MIEKILVFGASGFTGVNFLKYFKDSETASNIEIICVLNEFENDSNIDCACIERCNVGIPSDVKEVIRKVQPAYIANFIGVFGASSFEDLMSVNVNLSKNILQAVFEAHIDIKKILFIGSAAEYGSDIVNPIKEEHPLKPINFYGLSKVFQTKLFDYYYRNFNTPVVMARTFNLIGEGVSTALAIGNFNKQIALAQNKDIIQVGNLNTERDFLPVEDAMRYYWNLLLYGKPGEIYNVCSGIPQKMYSVLNNLIKTSGKELRIEVSKELVKEVDVPCIYGSPSKLKQLLKDNVD